MSFTDRSPTRFTKIKINSLNNISQLMFEKSNFTNIKITNSKNISSRSLKSIIN